MIKTYQPKFLRKIRLVPEYDRSKTPVYQEDIERIVEAFLSEGLDCSEDMAIILWERYSESMCAGWLMLPDDKFIVDCLRPFFEIEE